MGTEAVGIGYLKVGADFFPGGRDPTEENIPFDADPTHTVFAAGPYQGGSTAEVRVAGESDVGKGRER